jgi:hypothetical protein
MQSSRSNRDERRRIVVLVSEPSVESLCRTRVPRQEGKDWLGFPYGSIISRGRLPQVPFDNAIPRPACKVQRRCVLCGGLFDRDLPM